MSVEIGEKTSRFFKDEFFFIWPRLVQAGCILVLAFRVTGGDFKQPSVYRLFKFILPRQ